MDTTKSYKVLENVEIGDKSFRVGDIITDLSIFRPAPEQTPAMTEAGEVAMSEIDSLLSTKHIEEII